MQIETEICDYLFVSLHDGHSGKYICVVGTFTCGCVGDARECDDDDGNYIYGDT